MQKIFLFVFALLLQFFCSQKQFVKFSGLAQGTTYSVSYYDENGKNYQPQIDSILKDFDKSASIYDSASLISLVNRSSKPVKADKHFTEIFNLAYKVSESSGGAFDITVGPLVNAFGFGFKNKEKINDKLIDSLKKMVNYTFVKIENGYIIKQYPGITLDFNAIAQGYSVDIVSKFLESKGVEDYLVEIGGEVYAKGEKDNGKNWNVGIEKPIDNDAGKQIKSTLRLENKAIATSGDYRKFYIENGVRYSHHIDPATGYPVKHSLLSVSVIADTCAVADAYGTAFIVMGFEQSLQFLSTHKNLEAYFIYSDKDGKMKTYQTDGLKKLLNEQE